MKQFNIQCPCGAGFIADHNRTKFCSMECALAFGGSSAANHWRWNPFKQWLKESGHWELYFQSLEVSQEYHEARLKGEV